MKNPPVASKEKVERGGGLKEEELNRIVLSYLSKKGYNTTKEALLREANSLTLEELSIQSHFDPEIELSSQILFYNTADDDPSQYTNSYEKLKDWINGSLDMYRVELELVLFPIFLHCYLGLVSKGFVNEADLFFEKFGNDHAEQHNSELQILLSIKLPLHVKENELAKTFIKTKYSLEICRVSYELLTTFLHDNKLILLLSIINQHLSFIVFSGKPTEDEKNCRKNVFIGNTFAELEEMEQKKILWGTFEEDAELFEYQTQMKEGKKIIVPPSREDLVSVPPHVPPRDRIPLPKLTEREVTRRVNAFQESSVKVNLSSSSLPSICMYTFFNTNGGMNCMDISEDSSLMAAGFSDSQIRVWSLTGTFLYELKSNEELDDLEDSEFDYNSLFDKSTGSLCKTLIGHSGPVFAVKFSPDNRFLISCSEDTTARLWSLELYSNLVCFKGHNYAVWDVDFSPMGTYFATASSDRTARLWNTQYIYPLRIFAGHLGDVDCVKFHPNCNYLATGSSDKTCRLWDVQTGTCVRLFTGHTGTIYTLSISPNGKYLASSGEDKVINVFDLSTGKQFGSFIGHSSSVYSLQFSSDGNMLASASQDNTVRLWDFAGLDSTPRPSNLQLAAFPTKCTPVVYTRFTRKNVLLAGGFFTSSD